MREGVCELVSCGGAPSAQRKGWRPYLARFDEMKATRQLPSPTGVAMEIVRLTQDEGVSCGSLARVLMADPVLSGKVIKFANSALMQTGRSVNSVQEAVLRLGVGTLRRIALSFSLVSAYRQGRCEAFDYQAFWSRSLAQGVAAQELARQTRLVPPDEAFTTGLLAHIGQLALASVYPDKYAEVLRQAQGKPLEGLLLLEQEVFAANHCELSAAMFLDWGLPAEQAVAVERYVFGEPEDAYEGTKRLVRLLRVAHLVADLCLTDSQRRAAVAQQLLARAEPLPLAPLQLAELFDRSAAEWQSWGRILDIRTHSVGSIRDLVQQQQAVSSVATNPAEGVSSDAAGPKWRALVVFADLPPGPVLSETLQQAGYEVLRAHDAETGLALVLEALPQFILAPLQVRSRAGAAATPPAWDALRWCRQLRETQVGRQFYLLLLAEQASEEQIVAGFEAGADDVISWPLAPRILLARLRAGQRVVELQREIEREHEELRRVTAELAIVNRKLQDAALTDPLTGLPNRRYAFERLQQEWHEATRHELPLSCLMLDVDHFKRINDTHGHDVGDVVLQQTADLLRQAVRRSDVPCRIGGEEFLIVCPRTNLQGAATLAERIRHLAEQKVWGTDKTQMRVTLSVGVATRSEKARVPEDLIRLADQALYAAKQAGRNRVRCSS
ncbi:MAG: diguanylate cyclase [Gemmatales bacterium]|nr:diguanylate cyclase [Gemmatales bacterium]